jgi:hypothetical protein
LQIALSPADKKMLNKNNIPKLSANCMFSGTIDTTFMVLNTYLKFIPLYVLTCTDGTVGNNW